MRKLLIYFLSIICVLLIVDYLFGLVVKFQIKKGLPGDYKPIEYALKECNEDILILGNSIVINSLKPSIIEDSLGMTCYNAGASGQTLYYYHTILNCILKRYTPKMIILGLRYADFQDDETMRYNLLIPYYKQGYQEMDSVLESKHFFEKYLLKSNLYRYNTIWFRILLYNFIQEPDKIDKGFIGHEKPAFIPPMTNTYLKEYVSNVKMNLFKDIVLICKINKIKLVIYSPPMYTTINGEQLAMKEVEDVCNKNDILFYDDIQDKYYLKHQELFYDKSHINKYGAIEYTKMFVNRLKTDIKSQ